MNKIALWSAVTGVILTIPTLFLWQNHARTTDLSLDLVVWSQHLAQPVSISILIPICVAFGFAIGFVAFGVPLFSQRSKVRRLEAEIALSSSAGDNAGSW